MPDPGIGPLLASQLATEFSALRAPGNCPAGMYLIPTPETLQRWAGVFFVHQGPYTGAILRFYLVFPATFPRARPQVVFESEVFHRELDRWGRVGATRAALAWEEAAGDRTSTRRSTVCLRFIYAMVDPKTREWTPRGRLAQWQPHVDHVPHLLHALKSSFKTAALDAVEEHEATNKQVWSMYRHSRQTFLSLTAQRARHSSTRQSLYDEPVQSLAPASPVSPVIQRKRDDQAIRFTELDDPAVGRLWADLRRSLGER